MKNIRFTAFLKKQRASIDKFFLGAAVKRTIYQIKRHWLFKKISLFDTKETVWR